MLRLLGYALRGLLFFSQYVPEPVEAALPQPTALGDPLCGDVEPGGLDTTGSHAADFLAADDTTLLKDLEVLNDRRQADAERLRQGTDRRRSLAQLLDELPARRIPQR